MYETVGTRRTMYEKVRNIFQMEEGRLLGSSEYSRDHTAMMKWFRVVFFFDVAFSPAQAGLVPGARY